MVQKYSKDVVMQEDGAKYHHAKIPTAFKTKEGVICLKWPAQSPDLSPIKNLWKQLKNAISARRYKIRSIYEIEVALQQEWAKIKEEALNKLMESMPKRISEMLSRKGGATHY
jgi:thiamine biosynthesis protein ThiC